MFYQKQKKIMNTTSIDYNELDNNKLLSNVNF